MEVDSMKHGSRYYIPRDQFHIIDRPEIQPYIDKAPGDDFRFAVATAWLTGMRISEIVDLKQGNFSVQEHDQSLTINYQSKKHGRKGAPSFLWTDPFVSEIVLPYFRKAEGERRDRLLIRTTTRRYQQLLQKLNKELHGSEESRFITFHQMRHSRITYLVQVLQATIPEVMGFTGRATVPNEYMILQQTAKFRGRF